MGDADHIRQNLETDRRGIGNLSEASPESEAATLNARVAAKAKAEFAMDKLRDKFGRKAIERGIVIDDSDD